VKKLNKKVLGTVLALSLAAIIAVVAVVPALAYANNRYCDKSDSLTTFYGSGGNFNLQLPPGVPDHPTDLQFVVFDFDKRSTFGSCDVMLVVLWVPALNGYASVAVVSDSPNPEFFDQSYTVLGGTAVWNPAKGFSNIFPVSDTELEVNKRGDVLTAELTVPVEIALPFQNLPAFAFLGDMSFTLPSIKIEIRGFDSTFKDEAVQNIVPHPPLSGYTITQNTINKPAWVRFWSTPWLGAAPQYTTGTLFVHVTRTYTPPPAP
jgi:hypothetical protein